MSMSPRDTLRPLFAAMLLGSLVAGANAAGEAGRVVFARGITTVQSEGEAVRFIKRGAPLEVGDVVSTGKRSVAILGLRDSTRLTLRPDTVFEIEAFAHDEGEESAVMRLFKGGLRALTGLVGKRNAKGFKLATSVATIGIRGTEFDARLCEEDCAAEAAQEREAEQAGNRA